MNQPTPPPLHRHPETQTSPSCNRVSAGICAILLGWLGVHKFILGYKKAGFIMATPFLLVTLIPLLGAHSSTPPIFAMGFGVPELLMLVIALSPWIMALTGIIEGIIYLSKSDEAFIKTYVTGRKEWF